MKKAISVLLSIIIILNFGFITIADDEPSCSAKNMAVVDLNTGRLICSKNAYDKAPMASTTKIMTAVLLIENADLNDEIICTKEMVTVEGSSMGLMAGDRVHYYDLLYGMMLASGNDAANTTAISISGSKEKFVELMNEKAKQIGMTNTNFVTPSGLDDVEHYSTAYDMAKLACYAMKNEEFVKAVSSKTAKLNYGNPPYDRTLRNHNKLLSYYDECCGIKTGFTKKSGRCLVSCAKRGEKGVVCVTLNDPNDWQDHQNLLNYSLDKVELKQFEKQSVVLDVINSNEKLYAQSQDINLSLFKDDKVTFDIEYDTILIAPIKKGEIVGKVYYKINSKTVKTVNLTATNNIKENVLKKSYLDWIKTILIQ